MIGPLIAGGIDAAGWLLTLLPLLQKLMPKAALAGVGAVAKTAAKASPSVGVGIAQLAKLIDAHKMGAASVGIPLLMLHGAMSGGQEQAASDNEENTQKFLQQGQMQEAASTDKDLRRAMLMMQLAKMMTKAQDNTVGQQAPTMQPDQFGQMMSALMSHQG